MSGCLTALGFTCGLASHSLGQGIATPPPEGETYLAAAAPYLAQEPAREQTGTLPEAELGGEWMPVDAGTGLGESTAVAYSASDAVELIEPRPAGSAGRWRFSPHLLLLGTYDDNIFIQHANRESDYIVSAAAGVALGFWDGEEERARFLDRNHFSNVFEQSRGNLFLIDYT
ncbi:MAG: hypothetical protein M3032_11850, partial [Verrucomicrobiota bacterium]|nr:hypothetical protein [Verrucomicrobiota bacterium]